MELKPLNQNLRLVDISIDIPVDIHLKIGILHIKAATKFETSQRGWKLAWRQTLRTNTVGEMKSAALNTSANKQPQRCHT